MRKDALVGFHSRLVSDHFISESSYSTLVSTSTILTLNRHRIYRYTSYLEHRKIRTMTSYLKLPPPEPRLLSERDEYSFEMWVEMEGEPLPIHPSDRVELGDKSSLWIAGQQGKVSAKTRKILTSYRS
jgi:hypothetical protein